MIEVIHTGPFQVNTLIVGLEGSSALKAGESVLVVDPACCQFSNDVYAVSSRLEALKVRLAGIILTHGHFDHVAGVKVLKSMYPDVPVFINRKDSAFIGNSGTELQERSLALMGFEEFLPYVSDLPEADGFLENGLTLKQCFKDSCSGSVISGSVLAALDKWKVIHTPGHTQGSVCIYNKEERTLIAGDTVFYKSWGRTDLPGGSEEAIQKSLRKLYHELPENVKVYPGHDYYGFALSENL